MSKIKIHIDPENLPTKVTDKFKNFNKIEKKVFKFYTLDGLVHLFRKNKLLFTIVFILWLITLVCLVSDDF